ncbi:single-stranded-DNA-specific exonuclease RecJ [Robertkochia aurantiaca]|uniref:single-stranded-DNA-specific exonuclease RecJ n=1 Tax=Robertkochia aurantiaca TaxID=2873700 RepID=UPI001CC930A4|nr:single-stranded-DNA-specific exonuclease RecJ [Robertkochia sp. 3YJGBD-33]
MRWTLKPKPEPEKVKALSEALSVDELTASLLVQRDITTFSEARAFFRPSLDAIHDPFLMRDMDKAVDRIEEAISAGENILIYGDYDVDGTTAVSLVYSYLRGRYEQVATYIPDRYEEGYGVSYQGIDFACDNDISLIIALDCGIKAIDKVKYAKEKGVDFIICDHHRPGKEIPQAVAVLDPKRDDCDYPYDELCGCGVGFKLIQALHYRQGKGLDELLPYLDLVATAIAADIVPITSENRVLTYYGLQVINENPRPGLKALMGEVNKKMTVTDLVFIIAPRINAAGRMKHGQHAVNLLTETDINMAVAFAGEIENFNQDRRDLDQQITLEALDQIKGNREEERFTTVVYNELWHKGVIGIVASRLTETYYRPTLVFTKSGNKLAASARSVKGFDVYDALEACQECIEQFGGHKYAAGLTLLEEQYQAFKDRFEQVVSSTIDKRLLTPELTIDCELPLAAITPKFYRILKQFAPFGPGNAMPVFMAHDLTDSGYAKQVGKEGDHLKAQVSQYGSASFGAIGFGLGDRLEQVAGRRPFSAVFTIDENEWNGSVNLQLKLKDVRTK